LQRLAITEREYRLQACAFLHLGKIQHGIDQARAAAWSNVPGLCAQRHPDSSARPFAGSHLGRHDQAIIVDDLDVLMLIMFGHGKPPRRIRMNAGRKRSKPLHEDPVHPATRNLTRRVLDRDPAR
jgi:hypothetical protein